MLRPDDLLKTPSARCFLAVNPGCLDLRRNPFGGVSMMAGAAARSWWAALRGRGSTPRAAGYGLDRATRVTLFLPAFLAATVIVFAVGGFVAAEFSAGRLEAQAAPLGAAPGARRSCRGGRARGAGRQANTSDRTSSRCSGPALRSSRRRTILRRAWQSVNDGRGQILAGVSWAREGARITGWLWDHVSVPPARSSRSARYSRCALRCGCCARSTRALIQLARLGS